MSPFINQHFLRACTVYGPSVITPKQLIVLTKKASQQHINNNIIEEVRTHKQKCVG